MFSSDKFQTAYNFVAPRGVSSIILYILFSFSRVFFFECFRGLGSERRLLMQFRHIPIPEDLVGDGDLNLDFFLEQDRFGQLNVVGYRTLSINVRDGHVMVVK
jgi:hypothetical protein